jgi:hypothetical protein
MTIGLDSQRNPASVFLVAILAIISVGLGAMGLAVPDVDLTNVNVSTAPRKVHFVELDDDAVLTPAQTLPGMGATNPSLSPTTPSPRVPMERFSGEGAGRNVPLSTSSEDKRVFLLNSAASLRDLAHIGGCELTERPLGGTTRRCAAATERGLVAASPGIGE